jgi:crossover junction endodeoxyribonuclease RusA
MSATALPFQVPHTLQVTAFGTPSPQGSKRHVGHGILVDDNSDTLRSWREDVRRAALEAMEATPGWERDYPAVTGHFMFALARPLHHYVSANPQRELRSNAPRVHTSRPDLDKLLRSTWDALTSAGVYHDDNRFSEVWATKVYLPHPLSGDLDRPGVRIILAGTAR